MRIKLYSRGPEKWVPLEGPALNGAYDRQPSLAGGEEYVHLAWIRDGKVHVTRSLTGEEWSEPQPLSNSGAREPLLLDGENQEMAVVWLEDIGVKSCSVGLATSPDDGESWWHASNKMTLEGTGCRLSTGFSRGGEHFLLYSYQAHDNSCEKLEFCIMSSDWRRERLDLFPAAVCGTSLTPATLIQDDGLYVTWRMRRGRETSLLLNCSDFPWVEWLSPPAEILEPDKKAEYVSPKLISNRDELFLVYFVYSGSSRPLEKNRQRGNLMLRRLNVAMASPHQRVSTGGLGD